MGGPSYTRIPGSDALRTQKRGASAAAVVEGADRSSLARAVVDVGDGSGISVGRVVLRGPSVPLLLDVVDRLFPLLEPEELAVYLHLYRLAVVVEKNVCRVSRSELSRRTRLADRRLGRAIAGLVERRAIVLVDRDRDGTLYRVVFPDELLEVPAKTATPPAQTKTQPAKTQQAKTTTLQPTTTTSAFPAVIAALAPPSPPAPVARVEGSPRSVGDVCSWFAARFGSSAGRSGADVAACVLDLLEEGHTFGQIPAVIERFVQQAPKTTPLRDLARFS